MRLLPMLLWICGINNTIIPLRKICHEISFCTLFKRKEFVTKASKILCCITWKGNVTTRARIVILENRECIKSIFWTFLAISEYFTISGIFENILSIFSKSILFLYVKLANIQKNLIENIFNNFWEFWHILTFLREYHREHFCDFLCIFQRYGTWRKKLCLFLECIFLTYFGFFIIHKLLKGNILENIFDIFWDFLHILAFFREYIENILDIFRAYLHTYYILAIFRD